jgi:TonB family protein
MDLPIASNYLQHLTLLAQEEKQRFFNVPPFSFLLGLAAFTHIALVTPALFADVSDDIAPTKQVRLAFGIDKDIKEQVSDQPSLKQQPQEQLSQPQTPAQPKPISAPAVEVTQKQKTVIAPKTLEQKDSPPTRILSNVNSRISSVKVAPRRSGAASGGGYSADMPRVERGEAVSKYEQLLSGWINNHRVNKLLTLPAGASGRAVVRVRINRRGYVIFKTIEQSSGVGELDQAAIDSVSRASPVPAVPSEYPGGVQLEFLIPITFVIN